MAHDDHGIDALVQVSFAVVGVLTSVAADHDLSLTQLRLLAILRDRTPKMAELADFLGLEKSTVSGLVDRAHRRGLVHRAAEPGDARAVRIGLTAAGRQLVTAGAAAVAERLAPLLGRLSPAGRRRLRELLEQLLVADGLPA